MTRCDHGGKECPHTYSQAFYHPQFPARPRNNDGSQLIEVVASIVILIAFVVGLGWWAWIADASAVAR